MTAPLEGEDEAADCSDEGDCPDIIHVVELFFETQRTVFVMRVTEPQEDQDQSKSCAADG